MPIHNLNHVNMFLQVIASGSISSAARILRKSHTAVSSAVSNLEIDLCVELVRRDGYKVEPTEQALRLIPYMRSLLNYQQLIGDIAFNLNKGPRNLRVLLDTAIPPSFCDTVSSVLLDDFNMVSLIRTSPADSLATIKQDNAEIDIAITIDEELKISRFNQCVLGYTKAFVVAHPQHPLCNASLHSIASLANYRQISLGSRSGQHSNLLRPVSDKVLFVENFDDMLRLVEAGVGWGIAPHYFVDNERDAHKAMRAQQEAARPLCAWWLKQKATDLRALRLNRTMLWLPIESMPERNAEQVTALRGVPADKLKSYQERFAQGLYADLLVELEASLARAPFWFDGQRLVWECLQGLNAEQAMREVEMHFALLLQRLPGLVELRFHDGSAFADAATRGWISAHVMPHLQNDSAPRKVETVALQAEWDVALDEVQPVLRKDGLKAAVQVLKQGMKRAHGGRARFFWQLSLARLCFLAKKYELAKTQLESLDHQLHESGLHAWEPDLALDVLHLLHSCCELLPQNHAVRERKEDIYRRLCHLDLEVVLE